MPFFNLPIDISDFSPGYIFTDILIGILGVIGTLMIHGTVVNRLLMRFDQSSIEHIENKKYNWVFVQFYFSFIRIALVHVFEIYVWGVYLAVLGFLPNLVKAVLFAGSCYTTIGFVEDVLPYGRKSLAFYIALSGFFCLAWTTSAMIDMTQTYKAAWRKKYEGKKFFLL